MKKRRRGGGERNKKRKNKKKENGEAICDIEEYIEFEERKRKMKKLEREGKST